MDYTSSDAFATDAGTGNRLHQDTSAVTTAFSANDANGIIWELMALIEGAGLTPAAFNKTVPATYNQVFNAVQTLINSAVSAANPLDYKASVRVATLGNIGPSGTCPSTVDGVALALNDRILVKDQTATKDNGIYRVSVLGTGSNGTWVRAADADVTGELTSGMLVSVEEGTVNADSQWMLVTDGNITLNTTPLTFVRQGASTNRQIQPITASVAANALTIGASNLSLDFRSTTLTSGGVTPVSSSPSNLVVPATATLGTTSGVQSDLYVLALNNAGAIELGVVNVAGGVDLSEAGLITTTAISAAANAANVVYSTTARASVAYRVIGVIRSTQATAGTWATAPSLVQGAGGNALSATMSLGYGQTWQNVAGSRASGTTYYNTTGRPISVYCWSASGAAGGNTFTVNGVSFPSNYSSSSNQVWTHMVIVPPAASYSCSMTNGLGGWLELR